MLLHCCVLKNKQVGIKPGQMTTTSFNIHNAAWKNWPFSNLRQQHPEHVTICHNMSQHVLTRWPWKCAQHAATNKICGGMLCWNIGIIGQGQIKQLSYWLQRFLISFSGYWSFKTDKKSFTFFNWRAQGDIQYCSKVSWQSLEPRSLSLETRYSILDSFKYRVSSLESRGSSLESRVSTCESRKLMSLLLDWSLKK